jgi:hypothetical protein
MKMIYTMVGMQFRGSKKIVADMKRGEPLMLRRAAYNQFDHNAVEVWWSGEHIAFVKGTEVAELAAMMDRHKLQTIDGVFTTGGDRWPQVEVDSL